jgi:glycosyltransferase involved in cell wall biosynthesis
VKAWNPNAMSGRPTVTIGLPVFNGEQFLAAALDSLLAQTYSDIEILLSDNASTDSTRSICERYAARDRRVRYLPLTENIGGIPNHNRVFELSKTPLFMWASHDDLWAPRYVEACVEMLEADPTAVVAHSKMGIIDASGNVKKLMHVSHTCDSMRTSERFREFTALYSILEAMSGVMRSDVLRNTLLFLSHPGSDRILLAEMALRGRIVRVPEHLYFRRDHEQRSVHVYPRLRDRYAWIDPRLRGKRAYPSWGYLAGYARAVLRAPLSIRDRVACAKVILGWTILNRTELLRDFFP